MKLIKENKKVIIFGVFALIAMGVICLLLYEPLIGILKEPKVLKAQLEGYGGLGMMVLAFIMALQVVFVFLPGELIEVLAGFVYGPIQGMFVCLIGAAIGSTIIYVLVDQLGMRFVDKCIGKEKLKEVRFLQHNEKLCYLIFIIFFIPATPKDIITYFIPFTQMKLSKFLVISSVARIPSVISSTIGGNALGLQEYQFSIIVFAITGIVSLMGMYLYKHKIHDKQSVGENL